MGAHTSIIPEPLAGRAGPQHSPREGSRCLPSLLAGSHRTGHTYVFARMVLFTYLSFRGAKPRKQRNTRFYTGGLKLCHRCSFRGVRERIGVVEPSDECSRNDGSITQQRPWHADNFCHAFAKNISGLPQNKIPASRAFPDSEYPRVTHQKRPSQVGK